MPKAFLLKYKKQCEYFAQTPDQIGSCETSTEAINLKIHTNDSAQDMMVKGKKIITKIKVFYNQIRILRPYYKGTYENNFFKDVIKDLGFCIFVEL